jgi:hypothetical protein
LGEQYDTKHESLALIDRSSSGVTRLHFGIPALQGQILLPVGIRQVRKLTPSKSMTTGE